MYVKPRASTLYSCKSCVLSIVWSRSAIKNQTSLPTRAVENINYICIGWVRFNSLPWRLIRVMDFRPTFLIETSKCKQGQYADNQQDQSFLIFFTKVHNLLTCLRECHLHMAGELRKPLLFLLFLPIPRFTLAMIIYLIIY